MDKTKLSKNTEVVNQVYIYQVNTYLWHRTTLSVAIVPGQEKYAHTPSETQGIAKAV